MKVEIYQKDKHEVLLVDWLKKWDLPSENIHYISDVGLVVGGIAVAFLVTTNSKACYLDYCLTDPDSSKEERDSALIILIQELKKLAEEFGYSKVLALANLDSMRGRLEKMGFFPHQEYELYICSIGGI